MRIHSGGWWNVSLAIVWVLYLLCGLDMLGILEISSPALKSAIYLTSLFGAPMVLGVSVWCLRGLQRAVAIPATGVLVLLATWGPLGYANRMSPWRTRTELWVHSRSGALRIEDQFQDIGALGYRTRTVKLFHLGALFAIPLGTSPSSTPGPSWKPTNRNLDSTGHL